MKIRKAIIPAAGFGTRFLPATKSLPKEMLAVIDKPLILYSVEEAVQSGIESIAIITSRGKSSMEDYFDSSPELEQFLEEKGKLDYLKEVRRISGLAEFCYIRQKEALGLGHAVLMGEKFIGQEPFAVLLPDDIYDCPTPCTKQLIDAYDEYQASVIVLGRTDEEGMKMYGIVKPRQVTERVFQIEDLVEKPGPEKAFSDLASLGRYVFTPEIFEGIKKTKPDHRGEIQLPDGVKYLLEKQPVYGVLFEGERYDCGDKMGFLEATISLALKRPEFSEGLKTYLRSIKS
jgi:UTP--glucose-1-phosphate uridylyltransferase